MEFWIIVVFLVFIMIVLRILFGANKKQIKLIAKNDKLDEIAKKYPDNIEMCKEYLQILGNNTVIVEEDKRYDREKSGSSGQYNSELAVFE